MSSSRTAALILAAGSGTRFGGDKLSALFGGRPMLQHVLDLAAEGNLDPVVVVLRNDADRLIAACSWRAEQRVVNDRPVEGISTSVRLGLAALSSSRASRVAVLLGDQPRLTAQQLRVVLARRGAIVVPRYHGEPGNPVVLDRAVWPLAQALEGDQGMVQLFTSRAELVEFVDLPGDNPDVDTQADLAHLDRD